jgi:hypothetical protein
MDPEPAAPAYRQPLLTNFLLLLLTGLAYLNLRAHDVDYGGGISHPELGDVLFFCLTFLLYPLVNLIMALRARGRQATIYGLLSVIFFGLFVWLWAYLLGSIHKIGG